jgi:hypothetical protein
MNNPYKSLSFKTETMSLIMDCLEKRGNENEKNVVCPEQGKENGVRPERVNTF